MKPARLVELFEVAAQRVQSGDPLGESLARLVGSLEGDLEKQSDDETRRLLNAVALLIGHADWTR